MTDETTTEHPETRTLANGNTVHLYDWDGPVAIYVDFASDRWDLYRVTDLSVSA